MIEVVVVSREDLSHVIERVSVALPSGGTLADLMRGQCSAYTEDIARRSYLTLSVDGVVIPADMWRYYKLDNARYVRIVIEAGGVTAAVVMAIVSVVMAVASAVYGIIMSNKLGKAGSTETKQGSSIYDVNAQGNQVNLTNVIPETFGHFKHFPDYLADKHIFYRNNVQIVDMILCQGRGTYYSARDGSDVFVGETPISELSGCAVYQIDPGVEITAENSPEDKSWYCYYQSTEVTGSGHTLEPEVTEIDQDTQTGASVTYSGNTLSGGYYRSQTVGGGTSGPGHMTIYTRLKLWDVGALFTLSGSVDIRSLGTADAVTVDDIAGTATVTPTLPEYFLSASTVDTHKAWLRARVTDAETEEIVSSGDLVNLTVTNTTTVSYSIVSGTGGVEIRTVSNSDSITSQAELLGITYSGDTAVMVFDALEVDIGSYPAAPSLPSGAYGASTSYSRSIAVAQPMPDDYTQGSDNGLYEITAYDSETGAYTLQKYDEFFVPISGWVEFWAQGYTQTGLTFSLDDSSEAGAYVGPYRACPVGATATIFEYDIRFPSGLGYLQDNGTFSDLTVTVEIGYRLAGSSGEWTTEEKTFTAATNDELAYTYQLEVETLGNYEFRMKNTSTAHDSTRYLEEVKWVGLKSVISTVNQYDDMTVLICRFRGSETLSELSENQLATYWTRMLPPVGGGDLTPTTDLAPVVQYIVSQSKYAGIIDSDSLSEYDAYWRARGIELNGTIDSDSTLLRTLSDVLSVGFASPVVRDNKLAFSRLYERGSNTPLVQIFQPQNLTGSPEITFNLPKEDDVDEVVVEYTSPETYKTETIYCHVDNSDNASITYYPESAHQENLKAFGVTSYEQAVAMGMRRLRYLRNTRVTYKITTELDGLNCQFNDLVGLVLDEELSNVTGRVTAYDPTTLTITTDIEVTSSHSAGTVYLRALDGAPVSKTFSRVDAHHLTLDSAPFSWNDRYGADLEYPFFAIGEVVVCWVSAVAPQDKTCDLTLINYSAGIFTDDLPVTAFRGYGISPYGWADYGIYS